MFILLSANGPCDTNCT